LIALSVTMPQHLRECETMVRSVKEQYPEVKIAVGGRAFETTSQIWKKWSVDFYSNTAAELIDWSRQIFQLSQTTITENQSDQR
jgi:MerR family transcriptional regulator, light-induced transcriptional regulator